MFLLYASAMISGSEVAYFSLSPAQIQEIKDDDSKESNRIQKLKDQPRTLLATILISNNFINIAIVILSTYLIEGFLTSEVLMNWAQWLEANIFGDSLSTAFLSSAINFSITIVFVTFLLVLIGEVTPKIYANLNNLSFSKRMARPLLVLVSILKPISNILVKWTNVIEQKVDYDRNTSDRQELGMAIDLAVSESESTQEELDILKGIIKFNDVTVTQIMKSRVDVVAVDEESTFDELMKMIIDSGYSRIPVFKEDMDTIVGILYVKDLLRHTKEDKDFNWQALVRENILYVPESKKINELLKEFQQKRLHMAIVVDEYGGSSGLVTLEDIMEEVIGDIKDEFDDEVEIEYTKIDDNNFVFEGKSLLNDVCRIIGEDTEIFDPAKGESDSLAGLILEIEGQIPKVKQEIFFDSFKFTIEAATKRRIEKIKITILKETAIS